MKVTAAMVTSVNGKITNETDREIYTWTSPEDQTHFFGLIKTHSTIIMGSKTYLANKNLIKLEPNKLRIVITHHPETYLSDSVPGQLEFTQESATQLITRLAKERNKDILVVGGSQIFSQFLEANIIDRILLTVEPVIFGSGLPLIHPQKLAIKLKLAAVKQLNRHGTLVLDYQIQKE